MDRLDYAKEILKAEADAIGNMVDKIGPLFLNAVDITVSCKGRVVVTGLGKAGIIGAKISATLASTGTPSMYMHPVEALHGDLGMVVKDDVILVLSYSGQTEEIIRLLPYIKGIGTKLISITGNASSKLAEASDAILDIGKVNEPCPLGMVPTASATAMMAMGDALALVVADMKGFNREKYASYHPAGTIGKSLLLKVKDVMRTGKANPVLKETNSVREVLLAIIDARAGAASIVNDKGILSGIFTDGDLRRGIIKSPDILTRKAAEVMTAPVRLVARPEEQAIDALDELRRKKVDEMPVVDDDRKPVGMLDVQDILDAGLM